MDEIRSPSVCLTTLVGAKPAEDLWRHEEKEQESVLELALWL